MSTNDDGSAAPVDGLLTVATVRTWVVLAMSLLTAARPVINEANVFPVADCDTGTNLCLTLGDGRDALDALGPGVGLEEALRALARGALLGARGNSGIILSEYLRGFALGVARGPQPGVGTPGTLAAGLLEASRCAYEAVGHPREGTMLTAAAGAAQGAAAAAGTAPVPGLRTVVDLARAGAQAALERSVHELDVLRAANMLDAGAYGLVLVLDALGLALSQAAVPGPAMSEAAGTIMIMDSLAVTEPSAQGRPGPGRAASGRPVDLLEHAAVEHAPHTALDGEFEVMFVVEHTSASEPEIRAVGPALRERLLEVGNSVVVVGGADGPGDGACDRDRACDGDGAVTGTWQVHVHTDAPLDALRVAQGWTQRQVVVRCLPHQVAARAHGGQLQQAMVACVCAPGLVTDLARSGAVVVLRASAPVGRDDLHRGALETTAEHVVLVPGDPATLAHARTLAAPRGDVPRLEVVDSVSDLHVVAAASAWASCPEPSADEEPLGSARLSAVRAAVAGVRAATTDGDDLPAVLDALSGLLAEVRDARRAVLTVLAGDLVADHVVSEVTAAATGRCPGIEVVVLASGRDSAALVMGVDEL